MNKIPLSLIIDDSTPGVQLYYYHIPSHKTMDGRELLKDVPNSQLNAFCDVVGEYGIKGKFSVVPMPACRGDIVHGIEGMQDSDLADWISAVRARVMPNFDLCPEILTHERAIDLQSGKPLAENEMVWAAKQNRATLTPYIARAISLLCQVNLAPTGVTSPWMFGEEVEGEYAAAVALAFDKVLGKKRSWYFLHCTPDDPSVLPWVNYDDGVRRVVTISATFDDPFWPTINSPETSAAFVSHIADTVLTADGKGGKLLEFMHEGCSPVLVTHWQSLFSNGNRTGLRALELTARRIRDIMGDRVEWVNFSTLMNRALN